MTRKQIVELPAHEHDGVVYIERAAVLELQAKHRDNLQVLFEAFAEGVFVRDTARDNEPGWALRVMGPLAALKALHDAAQ